jgi:hypothetical protein
LTSFESRIVSFPLPIADVPSFAIAFADAFSGTFAVVDVPTSSFSRL